MTKYSIGNVVIGGNTLKNAPENNGYVGDQISQAGQGMATAFRQIPLAWKPCTLGHGGNALIFN